MITEYGIDRGRVISTEATVAHWLKKNQCPIHSKKVLLPDVAPEDETTVTHYTYNGCKPRVNVELFRIEGGGHTWPGGKQHLREDHVGKTSRDINACDEIWRFFQQF
jgi:polyhydroxybutyrate depolymerase